MLACAPPPQAATLPSGDTIERVSDDYWRLQLERSPIMATMVGEHRFDDRLDDLSLTSRVAHHKALRRLHERAAALQHTLTRELLIDAIENELRVDEACRSSEWVVDHLSGPQATLAELASIDGLKKRYAEVPRYIDQHIANLKRGQTMGWVAAEIPLKRTITQLDSMTPAMFGSAPAVLTHVMPALKRYRAFLQTLLPEARKVPGVLSLPIGAACYRAQLRYHTGLDLDPADVHKLGQSEVARIAREMEPVIQRIGKKKMSVREVAKLLDADPRQHVHTREALLKETRAIVARAQAALPRAFAALPKTPLVVEPLEAYREKESPAAFYSPAPMDNARPGRYLLNTFQPEARPAYDWEALAFHEGVPGHHLQVSLAQEMTDVPTFRRYLGASAYVEGWALYAEKLANELGLYSSDASQFGRLSSEQWRALRLLVDTGLHVYGWTREQAIETMLDWAASPRVEVENEVDRYITWPGQACAYKIGELEILRLRKASGLDLKEFHDAVLRQGPMPINILVKELQPR